MKSPVRIVRYKYVVSINSLHAKSPFTIASGDFVATTNKKTEIVPIKRDNVPIKPEIVPIK